MRVLDLFSGTGSSTQAFHDAGHHVTRVELDARHDADLHADVGALAAADLGGAGAFDFIWASPPCTTFSVASIGRHWRIIDRQYVPQTDAARAGLTLAAHTVALIRDLAPRVFLIENPRGMLRNLPPVQGLDRYTVWYCRYGDDRAKPTDLWGVPPHAWRPRPECRNGGWGRVTTDDGTVWCIDERGRPCHHAASRGSRTGTQGIDRVRDRSRVPYALGADLLAALTTP